MKYQFIEGHRSAYGVEEMCQSLAVSVSGYYAWRRRGKSRRKRANEELLRLIREIYWKYRRRYGSPRITEELRERGYRCSEKRVARLMRKHGIVSKLKKRFKITTQSKHNLPVADNVLKKNTAITGPNQVWVSDITYIWTQEGWLYIAAVMDVYARHIVGWCMSERLTQDLAIKALQQAILRRSPPPGVIFHSDRGSQYAAMEFRKLLKKYGFIQSMSGAGNCYDNALMESFYHTLKTELVYFERYATRQEARQSLFEYIEVFYNRQRKHSSLGYRSPVVFEQEAIPT